MLYETHQRVDEISGKKGYVDWKGREFRKYPFFISVCERVVSAPSDGKWREVFGGDKVERMVWIIIIFRWHQDFVKREVVDGKTGKLKEFLRRKTSAENVVFESSVQLQEYAITDRERA